MDSVDIEVLRSAVLWRQGRHEVLLVTVVETWGSSPRPVGAMAAVREDGLLAGSVSGGCVEDDLIERVRANEFFGRLPQFVTYGVTREQTQRFGLPCGGILRLLIEPVSDASALEQVLLRIERREPIARKLDLRSGAVVVRPAVPGEALTFDDASVTSVLGPRWRMLIIGAGDASRYLTQMALALNYQVLVCDPRVEVSATWNVPGASLVPGMPDDVVRELSPDSRTVIIALTHDPKLDDLALLEALKSDAFYVGAIGSRRNNAKRRARLAEHFALTHEELGRLHGPVGLPIGSRTPPEIALAILAEITALRHGITLIAAQQASPVGEPCPALA
jgi:xanthine dehydrogenase accessory factor